MEREMGKVLAKLESIDEDLQQDREARKRLYERVEATNLRVEKLTWEVEALKNTMNNQAPTIAEFLTYKEQVRGAGKLGKFIWAAGGILLGAAASLAGWLNWK